MKQNHDPVIRTSITLRASLWKRIEQVRADDGMVTTADAVRRILLDGLEARERQKARSAKK